MWWGAAPVGNGDAGEGGVVGEDDQEIPQDGDRVAVLGPRRHLPQEKVRHSVRHRAWPVLHMRVRACACQLTVLRLARQASADLTKA